MNLFQLAKIQNPWWQNAKDILDDKHLKAYNQAVLKYIPKQVLDLPQNDSVHIITGPRQIGKTTALKLLIKDLIKTTDPRNILYFNCDVVSNRKELVEFIIDYLKWRPNKKQRKYIFLDEVSLVPEWPFAVKWLVDSDLNKNVTFFLTGSSTIQLKKSGEYLPGRRGSGLDITLAPLDFREFLKLFSIKINGWNLKTSFVDLKNYYQDLQVAWPDLKEKMDLYFLSGGFPKVINELYAEKTLSLETVSLYQDWFKSEAAKNSKQEPLIRQIIEKVFISLAAPLSYQALSEYAALGSHNTAKDYLSFLQESFFIFPVSYFDINQKRLLWRKNKKYYFYDSFIFWLFKSLIFGNDNLEALAREFLSNAEDSGKFIENLAASELVKKGREVYYYQNQKEIDFVLPKGDLCIEVKWRTKVTKSDFKQLFKIKQGLVVSQNDFYEEQNVKVIPLELFLLAEI